MEQKNVFFYAEPQVDFNIQKMVNIQHLQREE